MAIVNSMSFSQSWPLFWIETVKDFAVLEFKEDFWCEANVPILHTIIMYQKETWRTTKQRVLMTRNKIEGHWAMSPIISQRLYRLGSVHTCMPHSATEQLAQHHEILHVLNNILTAKYWDDKEQQSHEHNVKCYSSSEDVTENFYLLKNNRLVMSFMKFYYAQQKYTGEQFC